MVQPSEPGWARPSDEDARAARAALGGRGPRCGVRETRTLQNSLRAPAQARTFVAERVCPRHGSLAIAAAALVASEVVSHAAVCGEGPITIVVECAVTTLTLSITCAMEGPSEAAELRLGDPIAGMIVDSICRATGALRTERGLTMWGTIPTGHIAVRDPRAEETSLTGPPGSRRPRTSMAISTISTLDASNPGYRT